MVHYINISYKMSEDVNGNFLFKFIKVDLRINVVKVGIQKLDTLLYKMRGTVF